MTYFTPDQITRYGTDTTIGDRALYHVKLPADIGYSGKVRVTGMRDAAPRTEEWIAAKLDDLAAHLSYPVLCGRLYSPLDLTD